MAERIAVPSPAPLLRMSGISKRFGATRALRGVSLELHPSQALALIGENGAGKSTLMKVLSGAHSPDDGTWNWRSALRTGGHTARTPVS
jgi:ABC-type sugar transport system ATPase subunit